MYDAKVTEFARSTPYSVLVPGRSTVLGVQYMYRFGYHCTVYIYCLSCMRCALDSRGGVVANLDPTRHHSVTMPPPHYSRHKRRLLVRVRLANKVSRRLPERSWYCIVIIQLYLWILYATTVQIRLSHPFKQITFYYMVVDSHHKNTIYKRQTTTSHTRLPRGSTT